MFLDCLFILFLLFCLSLFYFCFYRYATELDNLLKVLRDESSSLKLWEAIVDILLRLQVGRLKNLKVLGVIL